MTLQPLASSTGASPYRPQERCRICDGALEVVLDLGLTPLANALLEDGAEPEGELRLPLRLALCRACGMAQLAETVSPEALFSRYVYFSSFSDTMVAHAGKLVGRLVSERGLDGSSLVGEIASNDGYLLKHYVERGVPVLGVEPARNVAEVAEAAGVPTRCAFFSEALGHELAQTAGRLDVLHANNVLAHVPNMPGFLRGIAVWLKPEGVASFEFPYVGEMLEKLEFDTIYHEHVYYLALTPLARAFAAGGLTVVDVERLPIHGGSLRVWAQRSASAGAPTPAVGALMEAEAQGGLLGKGPYERFAERVWALKDALRRELERLKAEGRRVAAYGASAKGATLLNTFDIGRDLLDFVVDRSTAKQGLLTPGTHLRILPVEALREREIDVTLLLTWNFEAEILAQQAAYREVGGRFLIPVPQVHYR